MIRTTIMLMLAAICVAGAPTLGQPASAEEQQLRRELDELRRNLDETRRDLEQAQSRLRQMHGSELDGESRQLYSDWRDERARIDAERRAIELERRQLDATRQRLHGEMRAGDRRFDFGTPDGGAVTGGADRPGFDGRSPSDEYIRRYGPIAPNAEYSTGRYVGPRFGYYDGGAYRFYGFGHGGINPYRYYYDPRYYGGYGYSYGYGSGYYDLYGHGGRYPYGHSRLYWPPSLGYRYYYPDTGTYSRWYRYGPWRDDHDRGRDHDRNRD
jgi:hypothetical protein